jgi:hypothetical protein
MPYRPDIDPNLCFVLMPFGDPFDGYYERVLKPAIEVSGLSARRADEIYGGRAIIRDIWDSIWRARIVVADVTRRNPNVNYELGLCDALGVPTILITKRMEDVPFDYRHRRCIVYNTEKAGWEERLAQSVRKTIAASLGEVASDPELQWPYQPIEAGVHVRMTKYRYEDVMDDKCQYVLMTGHNFGDQFGTRSDPRSALYDQIIKLLVANVKATVHLVFAPPDLLKIVNMSGYKDLVEKSLPRMWDLANDPRLAKGTAGRLRITSHNGATFMSTFVRDPDDPNRALIVTTPRWVSDAGGVGRLFMVIWRRENRKMFDAVWGPVFSNLRTHEGDDLISVVEELGRELGPGYVDHIHGRLGSWRLPQEALS